MITLGTYDPAVSEATRAAYLERVAEITRVAPADVAEGVDKLHFEQHVADGTQSMSVAEVQKALIDLEFFSGGSVDGICGYRTLSAIRLFQEYLRGVEGEDLLPDGRFGSITQGYLGRWMSEGKSHSWAPTIARWQSRALGGSEYDRWLSLAAKAQAKYAARPNRMLAKVNEFSGETDTKKVDAWDFDPKYMHLIGIRREEFSGKFDDVFIFLMKGLVFKLQGTTEPGASGDARGRAFLVQGQHDYHFGWHHKRYLALRPRHLSNGVLIVRSRDERLDEQDLDRDLETNYTINIHWGGGSGIGANVGTWSEGCQVIKGSVYFDPEGRIVDCSSFVANQNSQVSATRTRGAYNVLVDLATALSGDLESNTVKYLLLAEEDLALDPDLERSLADARGAVRAALAGP